MGGSAPIPTSSRGRGGVNRTKVHWLGEIPPHAAVIEAVPGIGNVGKLIVDGLVSSYESKLIAMFLHPDMPPHATLDSDGILRPAHISVHSVRIGADNILCIGSNAQPMTASGQFEMAECILETLNQHSTATLYVLAGLAMPPESKGIHLVCSDLHVKSRLESKGLQVKSDQPESGMIGLAGLLISMAPIHGVEVVGLVAETVGGATDAAAAERLSRFMQEEFGAPVALSLDRTQKIATKLLESVGISESAIAEIMGEQSLGDLYV